MWRLAGRSRPRRVLSLPRTDWVVETRRTACGTSVNRAMNRLPSRERQKRVAEVLELVRLGHLAARYRVHLGCFVELLRFLGGKAARTLFLSASGEQRRAGNEGNQDFVHRFASFDTHGPTNNAPRRSASRSQSMAMTSDDWRTTSARVSVISVL